MGRRAGANELSRHKILVAARKLFEQQGYRQVSMRQIARSLGYSHGSLYYHFRDKAELFASLVERDFQRLNESITKALEAKELPPSLNRLEVLMLEFIQFGLSHPSQYEMMFMMHEPELLPLIEPIKMDSFTRFAEAVHVMVDPEGKYEPDRMLPWLLFISMHGFVSYYIQAGQQLDEVQPFAERFVRHLYRGLPDQYKTGSHEADKSH